MVTKVSGLVLGNAEVHYNHLNSDVFGPTAGLVVEGNKQIVVTTTGDLSGGGTIVLGQGGTINLSYNEPTNVSYFTNDSQYVSVGDDLSLFTNNPGYVVTGSNVSIFNNDVAYVSSGANVSVFVNDSNYVVSGSNISVFANDAGYLTTETDPTVPAHVKSIATTDISNWNTAYGWGNHSTVGYFIGTNTDDLPEGSTNLYFTDERVDDRVAALLVAGTNIDITYDDGLGTLTVSANGLTGNTTDDLTEGSTNLYYTDERVDDRVSNLLVAGTAITLTYDDVAGTLTIDGIEDNLSNNTTTDLAEGSNLYYTDTRARAALSGGTGVTYNNTTGEISIGQNVATTANVTFDAITANSVESLDHIHFDVTTGSPTFAEGTLFYDNVNKTLAVYNQEPDITLQIGQEQWIRVYNGTASTIGNGKPVYISGTNSGWPTIALANANSVNTYNAVGLATHDIEAGTYGYVTTKGVVRGLNTSNLIAGGYVHVGPSDGVLQLTAATYPNFPHEIGICVVSDATDGSIYVSTQQHSFEEIRTSGNARVDGNLTIGGDFTVLGSQNISSVNNLKISNNFMYLNSGDTIGDTNTIYTGTGLDDAILVGHYNGLTTKTFYVRIDSTGTPDTFEWSLDNFSTTEATGVAITGAQQLLSDNIYIEFNATTGHAVNDTWSGTAAPVNVDVGFAGNRNTGTSGVGYTHNGLFFDVTDEKWKFFDEYDPEVQEDINTGDASFSLGIVQAASFEGTVDWSYLQNVPDPIVTVNLSGDVSGSGNATLTNLGNGTINIAATVANDSHTHDGRYFTETESDARYAPISHTHAYDNYGGWNLSVAGTDRGQISSNERVSFVAGTNVSLGYSATDNTITVNSTYTDTTDWRVANSAGTQQFAVNATNQVRFAGTGATTVAFDSGTKTITFSSTDTDTWRPIHDTSVSGATTTSISSNWAYVHETATSVHGSTSSNTANRIVLRDASGNFSAGIITAALSGNATTATTWATSRTLSLTGDVTGSVTGVDGSGNISIATTIAANSVALGTDTTGNYAGAVAVSGNGLGLTGTAGEGTTFTVTSNATSVNTPSTIVFRDASGNFSANLITATTTQARYADLAEKYTVEYDHPVGTVMQVAYDEAYEITKCGTASIPVGVISEKPAFLMNETIDGQAIALKGRVPVRVVGQVRKGEAVYAHYNGCASVEFNGAQLVGIALETNNDSAEKLVECVLKL